MKLSILTATFNRGEYLKKIYKSILQNLENEHKKDFVLKIEWIIIDDGSTDNTESIVQEFILENKVDIKYIYEKNRGKMYAINVGCNIASGDLIVDCDSDDYFSPDAFEIINKNALELFKDESLYALCFLKKAKDQISGKSFKENYMISTMFDLYFKDNIKGEKILVFNSKIRKKYKHELVGNEKFVTEARMYYKMDENYKILCINNVIEEGVYLENGYTNNIKATFKSSPKGYYMYFKEILKKDLRDVLPSKKIYIIKHYLYFALFFR